MNNALGQTKVCEDCPAGYIAPNERTVSCTPCGAGTQPNSNRTSCDNIICGPGTRLNDDEDGCTPCPEGHISTATDNNTKSCYPCGLGTYKYSGFLCRPCPSGQFTSTTGNSQCSPCPPGTKSSFSRVGCVDCTPGTYASGNGNSTSVSYTHLTLPTIYSV